MEKRGKSTRLQEKQKVEVEIDFGWLESKIKPIVRKIVLELSSETLTFQWRLEKGGIITLLCLFRLLKEYDLIPQNESADNFIAIFRMGKIAEPLPVRWKGAINQLAYLMNWLLDKENAKKAMQYRNGYVVYDKKRMNKIICRCFIDDATGEAFKDTSMRALRDNSGIKNEDARIIDELIIKLNKKRFEVMGE